MINTLVSGIVGKRNKITREEMRQILVAYLRDGGDLGNGYVQASFADHHARDCKCGCAGNAHEGIALAWERTVRDATFVSVGTNLRDGGARYDQPGSMAPMQKADISLIAAGQRVETVSYLRHKCARLLIVTGEPTPLPEKPKPQIVYQCDNGHKWTDAENKDDHCPNCPKCGEYWV